MKWRNVVELYIILRVSVCPLDTICIFSSKFIHLKVFLNTYCVSCTLFDAGGT